jgi:hypothetical protein
MEDILKYIQTDGKPTDDIKKGVGKEGHRCGQEEGRQTDVKIE